MLHQAARYVMPYLVLVMTGLLVLTIIQVGETQANSEERDEEQIALLVKNCEQNGNPLREVLTKRANKEITETYNTSLYESLFPGFPADELHKLIVKHRKELIEERETVKPLNCKDEFE